MILKDFLLKNAQERPQSGAFVFLKDGECVSVSWEALLAHVNALGTWLMRTHGRCPVFILGENSYRWMLAHCSAICGAGVAVAMDKERTAEELSAQIRQLEPGVIFYAHTYRELAHDMQARLSGHRFVCMDSEDFDRILDEGARLVAAGDADFMNVHPSGNDLAAILFTSGTTAGQKGVMLAQKNILTPAVSIARDTHLAGSDRMAMLLPLHHSYACYCSAYSMFVVGGTLCVFSGFKHFFDVARHYRTNVFMMVPALYTMLLEALDVSGLKGRDAAERFFGFKVKLFVSGGAPLARAMIDALAAYGVDLVQGYGLTECSPLVSVNPPEASRAGTVGKVIRECEVRIAPDGEIMVRGDNVMLGYLHNPEAQEKVFRDGWLLTGDIGSLDADGYLTILGRKKNLIVLSNGKNLFPEELEEKLLTLPSVQEVLVFQEGDGVSAEVYSTFSFETVQTEIRELNRSLPTYERIRHIEMRDAPFERSSLQKTVRR